MGDRCYDPPLPIRFRADDRALAPHVPPMYRLPQSSAAETLRLTGQWQVQPVSLDAPLTFDALTSTWIDIPECAHLQTALYPDQPYWGDRLRAVNERAWVYRRTFHIPERPYQRARLRFEAVDYFAEVWINEQYAGQHEGNFNPFDMDITPHLIDGENVLTVRVSAPWDAPDPNGTYPTDHVVRGLIKGLYEHGEGVIPPNVNPIGIWRPVWLILDQGISIDHVRIRTDLSGRVDVRVTAANTTRDTWRGSLALTIRAHNHSGAGVEACIPLTLAAGTQTVDHVLNIPDPHLWWSWDQGSPDLYTLDVSLLDSDQREISRKQERFGVRTVELIRSAERFEFRLNDRPVFIRGSAYIPALYLSEVNDDLIAHDLALAREAHLNLLRVHVHVSPPEVYDRCDEQGMLVWQDFELNWVQESSPDFERRACALQHDMIAVLQNHPSIMTWACHNEPTMLFTRRRNVDHSPDPALYADAQAQDTTRPVFICSGQMEDDWQRSGDSHTYYGALWTPRYTDIYDHRPKLNTEFGFETPAAASTLRQYPEVWERLKHLDGQIETLWAYQAALIQTHIEHFRRLRAETCAGYVHFWLADLVPQVGCGVLDSCRLPKGGYEALCRASQPLLPALEHDGERPIALWVFNDTRQTYENAVIRWQISDGANRLLMSGETIASLKANASQQITPARWSIDPADCARITLSLYAATGEILSENGYDHPFAPLMRPRGYPWKFDPVLGTKVFDREGAPSLADQSAITALKVIPLRMRESIAEWALRQRLPLSWLRGISRVVDSAR